MSLYAIRTQATSTDGRGLRWTGAVVASGSVSVTSGARLFARRWARETTWLAHVARGRTPPVGFGAALCRQITSART